MSGWQIWTNPKYLHPLPSPSEAESLFLTAAKRLCQKAMKPTGFLIWGTKRTTYDHTGPNLDLWFELMEAYQVMLDANKKDKP